MESFTVVTPRGERHEYGAGSTHAFDEHGHLVTANPDGVRRVYSVSGWAHLEEHGDGESS